MFNRIPETVTHDYNAAGAQMIWTRPRIATPNSHQMRKTRQHLDKLPSLHTESTKLQLLRILLQVMSYLSLLVCGRDTCESFF